MSIGSLFKRLTDAVPVVLAAAPGVIDAVRQVRQALKKPKKPKQPAEAGDDAVAAGAATIER